MENIKGIIDIRKLSIKKLLYIAMGFFRSEEMELCQLVLHKESAFDCIVALGYLGKVEFVYTQDYNDPDVDYTAEIKRCTEMLKIIERIEQDMVENKVNFTYYPDVDEKYVPRVNDLNEIEASLQLVEVKLNNVVSQTDALEKDRNYYQERWHVLKKADEFLTGTQNAGAMLAWSGSVVLSLLQDEMNPERRKMPVHLSYVTGTVPVERFATFEVLIWRLCRGNCYIRHAEIEPNSEEGYKKVDDRKYVFIVFFVGEALQEKIVRACQGFRIVLYECPETRDERTRVCRQLQNEVRDINAVLKGATEHRKLILNMAASDIYIWKVKLRKTMMVFNAMNQFSSVDELDVNKYMQIECWVPRNELRRVRKALVNGAKRAAQAPGVPMFLPLLDVKTYDPTEREPPTLFALNKFTKGFQNLIDAYGMANYKEINPAPYTVITFPFLFAVMFGDMGHGIIMTLFSVWLILKEKKIEENLQRQTSPSEISTILFAGRYILLLMGVFSIYTGLIYNDVFSKSFNLFGSKWRVDFTNKDIEHEKEFELDPRLKQHFLDKTYPFGMDPVWKASGENAIITMNSMKMKMAIILGVSQMIFGYTISAFNYVYFKKYTELYFDFIPQMVFLICLFGYLCFLIIFKWCYYGANIESPRNSACAPSILITFINMVLLKSSGPAPSGCEKEMFPLQFLLQYVFVAIAFLSIPILLLGKPLYLTYKNRRIPKIKDEELQKQQLRETLTYVRNSLVYHVPSARKVKEEKFSVSDVWIHQGISCIESVLGSVSHTASYLRLWALSLAHDQLSTVLWNMVLRISLKKDLTWYSSIMLCAIFAFWAVLTISILVVMEGLSAFLHTLRLHWVEFQSKFYKGNGVAFKPFSFGKSTLNQ